MKWPTIRRLVRKHSIDLLCLQETKKEHIDNSMCQALWGNPDMNWEIQPVVNTAGGLLCIWSDKSFKVDRKVSGSGYIMLEGTWIGEDQKLFIVNIYALCDPCSKRAL